MKKRRKAKAISGLDATNPQNWIKSKFIPAELRQQLSTMSDSEKATAFSKTQLEFGTAGIRAKMGPGPHYMNIYVYQQMMIGYCKYVLSKTARKPSIIIGHDNRLNSDVFAFECANVAKAMGINAYLMENNKLLPTPIVSYAIKKHKFDGGVNITASHNPKEDNGFKAYNNLGAQILPNDADEIIRFMPKSNDILDLSSYLKAKRPGEIRYIPYNELVDSFFDELIEQTVIDKPFLLPKAPIKKFPIVFTGFHGTTTELLPKLLKRIGFKKIYVYPKHDFVSGKFEDCPISNPEDSRAFKDVIKYALDKKATMVIGCDPDGDRMAVGFKKTNRWRFLSGNEMGIIFSHYILNHKQFDENKVPLIISTHVSTSYVDRIAAKHKAQVWRTKTGFKWLGNKIDGLPPKYEFILGFEEAIGSLPHKVCRDKDAFGAILLALEVLNRGNAYFADLHDYLCDRIYDEYGPTHPETFSFKIQSDNWKEDAKVMMDRALHMTNKKLFDYTIQKVWYQKASDCVVWTLDKESWIKFRLSGTEPKFKVYFNFNNEMAGQLKAASVMNIAHIEETILKGFKYTK